MAENSTRYPDGKDRREHHGWHLDKRLNVGHILTTLSIVLGAFVWGSTMEKRIALLEQAGELKAEQYKADMSMIRESLVRIEAKLDSKADKRSR